MWPERSISPYWYRLGVSPKWAPTAREWAKRPGSSTALLNARAMIGPTPGAVISRRQTASSRTGRRTRRSSSFLAQGSSPGGEHRLGDRAQRRRAACQLAHPPLEPGLARRAELEAEVAQEPAQAQGDVLGLADQELARRQEGSGLLGGERLDVHCPVPARANDLRHAAGIVAVGLVGHGLEGRLQVSRPQPDHRRAEPRQAGMQPLREGPRLEADPHQWPGRGGQSLGQAADSGASRPPIPR